MRPIDADAFRKVIERWIRTHWDEAFTGDDVGSDFLEMIDEEPTLDAKPVVHAHWIKNNYDNVDGTIYKCSNCNTEFFSAWNYCPHCGARMNEPGTGVKQQNGI